MKINPIVTILRKLLENVLHQNERGYQVRERYGIQETRDLTQGRDEGVPRMTVLVTSRTNIVG